jgi:hypothetical protein
MSYTVERRAPREPDVSEAEGSCGEPRPHVTDAECDGQYTQPDGDQLNPRRKGNP